MQIGRSFDAGRAAARMTGRYNFCVIAALYVAAIISMASVTVSFRTPFGVMGNEIDLRSLDWENFQLTIGIQFVGCLYWGME